MRLAAVLLLLALGCSKAPVEVATDTREPIEIKYVGAPELDVRGAPREDAAVVSKYQNGEAISVIAKQGEWAEIRTGVGTGWVKYADLTTADAAKADAENPQPKFRRTPMPVTAPAARGEIYIEADVNTDGRVTATRILHNTTGSTTLATQNEAALQRAQFYPIVQRGERKAFKYYHRVTY